MRGFARQLIETVAPEAPLAIDDAGAALAYGDLPRLEAEWREALPGRRLVVLKCRNTTAHLGAFIGLMLAGHALILVGDKIAPDALEDIVKRFKADAVVAGDASGVSLRMLRDAPTPLHPDLCLCLSTSGSTGSPKLVRLSAAGVEANARAIAAYLELGPDERPLAHLPMEYSFGMSIITSHLTAGASLRLTELSVMEKPFWTALSTSTSFSGVPFHFEMLKRMRIARMDLPQLRTLTQAGGRLAPELAAEFHALAEAKGWRFHIMYGQTEAGPRISWLAHEDVLAHPGAIGRAIPDVTLKVEAGELVVESPSVMMGYAEIADDLARGDEMGGRLRTGDLAEECAPGVFQITGRKSRFIKLQGNRVGLDDVESALARAGIDAWCAGADDALAIFAKAAPETTRAAALAAFSFPARAMKIIYLDEPPRRSNGKVDYAKLGEMAKDA